MQFLQYKQLSIDVYQKQSSEENVLVFYYSWNHAMF